MRNVRSLTVGEWQKMLRGLSQREFHLDYPD
jgi:hypothetical protein